MKVHTLKIWPHFLAEIIQGRKTFDIRSTKDRVFQAGDQIQLQAFDPVRGEFIAGQAPCYVNIVAVYSALPGLEPGYVALSIVPVNQHDNSLRA